MIKVMVVEDEPPTLREIVALIEETNQEFKVVATANNGQQAIDLIQLNLPQIIFTDIQMPLIDGLELIAYLKEKKLDTIPVILSGYDEFPYAKKAMSLGVKDYLLKPVNEDELKDVLQKAEKEITSRISKCEREYLNSLVEEKNEDPDFDTTKLYHKGSYLAMLLCIGSFPKYTLDYYSTRKEYWQRISLEKRAHEAPLSKNEKVWVFDGKTLAEKVLIFTLEEATPKRADSLSQYITADILPSRYSLTTIVSHFIQTAEEIGEVLNQLRSILYKRIILGEPQIIKMYSANGISFSNTENSLIDSSLVDQLIQNLEQGNMLSFKSGFKKILIQWKNALCPQIWVERQLRELVSIYYRSFPVSTSYNTSELDLEINEAISMSGNYDELFANIWYIFENGFNNNSVEKGISNNTTITVMQKIDKYISENLTHPINTQILSEMFGLVPSYLSKLFREYKGFSPSDYLTHLRVEKAKELIQSCPTAFTKNIAESVGYSDPLYFSKVFKKETGMSPSEYKNTLKFG